MNQKHELVKTILDKVNSNNVSSMIVEPGGAITTVTVTYVLFTKELGDNPGPGGYEITATFGDADE